MVGNVEGRSAGIAILALGLVSSACGRSNSSFELGGVFFRARSSLSTVYSVGNGSSWTDVVLSDQPDICALYRSQVCAPRFAPVDPPGDFLVLRMRGTAAGAYPVSGHGLRGGLGIPPRHFASFDPEPGQSSVLLNVGAKFGSGEGGTVTLDAASGGAPAEGQYELDTASGAIRGEFHGAACVGVEGATNFRGPQCDSTTPSLGGTCECNGKSASAFCQVSDAGPPLPDMVTGYECECVNGDGGASQCFSYSGASPNEPAVNCCPMAY
jgi:hypothetical protein